MSAQRLLAATVLPLICIFHLRLGALPIDFSTILAALLDHDAGNYAHLVIVWQRLTRLAVALYCGASLGLAGMLLQKIMRNGLVSPSTLGINAGAVHFAVLTSWFAGLEGASLFVPSLLGGTISLVASFVLAALLAGQASRKLELVLAGSIVSAVFSALTAFVISLDPDTFAGMVSWLIGDIGNFDYLNLPLMVPLGAAAAVVALALSPRIDLLALGDEQAAVIGVNVAVVYGATLAVAIVLAVSAVSVVGPIGFIGLVVPHMVRLTGGDSGRGALISSMMLGAAVLAVSDILARTLMAPRVLEVGIVMGLAGGCLFLGLVILRVRKGSVA